MRNVLAATAQTIGYIALTAAAIWLALTFAPV